MYLMYVLDVCMQVMTINPEDYEKEVNIEGIYSSVRIITSLLKQTPGLRYSFPAVLICFQDFKITAQGCDFYLLWGLLKKLEKNTTVLTWSIANALLKVINEFCVL